MSLIANSMEVTATDNAVPTVPILGLLMARATLRAMLQNATLIEATVIKVKSQTNALKGAAETE